MSNNKTLSFNSGHVALNFTLNESNISPNFKGFSFLWCLNLMSTISVVDKI